MKKVTIVLPAYNEEESIPLLKEKMIEVSANNANYQFEFLIVNDGSKDSSLAKIVELNKEDSRFSYIDLSRNYGKEVAMMAGFDYAQGDAVIVMDADMQHPIDVIPKMLELWEEGYQDVYAVRKKSEEGYFKKYSSKFYYKVLSSISRVSIQRDTGDFRLLDRMCVEALCKMRETQRNTKFLYSWIGFKKIGIEYDQSIRLKGETKWNLISLMSLAIDGLTSSTTLPLKFSSMLGVCCSLIGFFYLTYIVIKTIFFNEPVQGYPTIMVTILFLGGVQLLSLGIIGEYLGRIFNETKKRPPYFINTYNGNRIKI